MYLKTTVFTFRCHEVIYKYFNLNNWAKYIDKINRQDRGWSLWLLIEYMPNRLTLLYSKIYYKKENHLKVKTAVFKYITPPYSKGWVCRYINILIYCVPIFLYSYVLNSCYILFIWFSYPSSYGFTSSISSASYALILT